MSPEPHNILVRTPNWVGDAVMSTPCLRALRNLYPSAKITLLARSYVCEIYNHAPWFDEIISYEREGKHSGPGGFLRLTGILRRRQFDLAVLLPNSFGSALMARLAGIPHRIGYQRDGRGWLLTDSLQPIRSRGRVIPRNMVDYYLELCHHLGARNCSRHVELFVSDKGESTADKILGNADRSRPLIGLNPGGAFGSSKCWMPERFAKVADLLFERYNAQPILFSAPSEKQIADRVVSSATHPILRVGNIDLDALKSLMRRCTLLVTNDTGARHIAVAFDKPVVVIMGSTSSLYTDANLEKTMIVRKRVDCGPCQQKICKQDHRCMTSITVEDVVSAVDRLIGQQLS